MKDENLEDIELDYDDNEDTVDINDVDFEIDESDKEKIVKELYVAKAEYDLDNELGKKQSHDKHGYTSRMS